MILVIKIRKAMILLVSCIILILIIGIYIIKFYPMATPIYINDELSVVIYESFGKRNMAIVDKDTELLESLYDTNTKYGRWAYEHELKKMKYLDLWSQKQGVKLIEISSKPIVRWVNEKGSKHSINLMVTTEYKYVYEDDIKTINSFRIGAYHSLDIYKKEDKWLIAREWYTDPFADSLHLDKIKSEDIKEYILSSDHRDFSKLNNRRINALEYADKYCGAAGDGENDFKYNKKYRNYNSLGGDCANFASQILHEGGFRKNYTWNYDKGGSRAWVNANSFKGYWLYSGRASLVAYGSYEKVYKASYKLLPGDFIGYGKNGKVTHISVVTGADSKGYTLVNCHNTDRYRVPWDLGWSDKGIRFWLVHVHY